MKFKRESRARIVKRHFAIDLHIQSVSACTFAYNRSYYTIIFACNRQEGAGEWVSLDAELIVENGTVVGTRNPTGDYILLDCRFELPYGNIRHVARACAIKTHATRKYSMQISRVSIIY